MTEAAQVDHGYRLPQITRHGYRKPVCFFILNPHSEVAALAHVSWCLGG